MFFFPKHFTFAFSYYYKVSIISVNVEGCSIVSNSLDTVGNPTVRNSRHSIYSCLSSKSNSNYNVHVISMHQIGSLYYGYDHNYNSTVSLNVNGPLPDKPLILAFVSYEPVQWILYIPEGVVVSKVILVSLMLENI